MTVVRSAVARRNRIVELLGRHRVHSQAVLLELLSEDGYDVTQATVSRDLDEIGATKIPDDSGVSVYAVTSEIGGHSALASPSAAHARHRLVRTLAEVLVTADSSGNVVVLRTPPGAAAFLAAAVDAAVIDDVIGTVAGDDTVVMITRDPQGGAAVATRMIAMAEQRR